MSTCRASRSLGATSSERRRKRAEIAHLQKCSTGVDIGYIRQSALKAKLAPYGTAFESWYPLGHGDKQLLGEPIFSELSEKYGKSVAQIILRWHIQEGNIVFPKTTDPRHLRDNTEIFDFCLTDAEMQSIDALDRGKSLFDK